MSEQAVEDEVTFNGGDVRAAKAIVDENTDLHGMAVVVDRIEQAQGRDGRAA